MNFRKIIFGVALVLGLFLLIVMVMPTQSAFAGKQADVSTENVYWYWDSENATGQAQLIRKPSGIKAIFKTSELPVGQAITLWVMVFNNPEKCSTNPCTVPDDFFTPGVEGDFHFVSGQVVSGEQETFSGQLDVGDNAGSGRAELGIDGGVPLLNPYKAEIVLAIHSHGPAQAGDVLEAQLSSFAGGCEEFNGPNGFATSPEYLPDAQGECSTIQYSLHQ